MPPISYSHTQVFDTNEFTQLRQFRLTLREHFTRIYPTRYKPLCPPAYGALFDTTSLDLPGLEDFDGAQGLLVFLPQDFAPGVETMVGQCPEVLVHPHIGLREQRSYYSWSYAGIGNELPMTLWASAHTLHGALQSNELSLQRRILPLVFVAGNTAAVGELTQSDQMQALTEVAMERAALAPAGYSAVDLKKAQDKALLYSECPWLLMRYELKNANKRMAVNLAAICKMNPTL